MRYRLLFIMLMILSSSWAMWERTNGPDGGDIQKIIEYNGYVFTITGGTMGQNGSVYRSDNEAESWDLISSNFNINYGVTDIVTNEMYIFAGTKGFGIYRSSDSGDSWTHIETISDLLQTDVRHMYADNNVLIVATYTSGIYYSMDNGDTWSMMGQLLTGGSNTVNAIISHNDTKYIATHGGVYKFENQAWSHITEITEEYIRDIKPLAEYLFLATTDSIYRFNPADLTFENTGMNGSDWIYIHNDTIYTSDYQIINYSSDLGSNWNSLTMSTLNQYARCTAFYIGEDYWLSGNGVYNIYKSVDDGSTWENSAKGITNINTHDFAIYQNELYAVTEFADFGRIYRTSNQGEDWIHSDITTDQLGYISIYAGEDFMLAGSFGNGIYRSENGLDWSPLGFVNSPMSYPTEIIEHNGAIYTGALGFNIDIYKSSDNGFSFQSLNVPGAGDIHALYSQNGVLYYGRTDGMYMSADDGMSWQSVGTSEFDNLFIRGIEIFNGKIYATTVASLIVLNDNDEWEEVELGGDYWISSIEKVEDKLLVGTREDGIFEINTDGVISNFSSGLPFGANGVYPRVLSIYSDDSYAYLSAEMYGVYRIPLDEVDIEENILENNRVSTRVYPNPFNVSLDNNISIELDLKRNSEVKVEVFNILGQRVKTIKSNQMKSGLSSMTWDGRTDKKNESSSGIYFIKTSVDEDVGVEKLIIVK